MTEFVVTYDILDEGIGGKPLLFLLGFLSGAGVASVLLIRSYRRRESKNVGFLTLFLTFWICVGGFGIGNVFVQKCRCLNWARNGDFQVVEGDVRDFQPMPKAGHARESFTVSGVRFDYSDFDASTGSFNNAASHGGPIQSGLYVRIRHHDGRILKIEIRKQAEPHS